MTQDRHDRIVVRGTEILPNDSQRVYRQKIARVTLDSMVQFVGLLDARGTVLEINKVALDAVGVSLADVEGRPFWTTFWWQVSPDINRILREMIACAAAGEFVRWDTEIFGRAGGSETIVIDASLCPVKDDTGKVVYICAEGRDITQKKAHEREIAQKNTELQGLLERIRELDEIKTQFFANVSHELRTPLALILGPAQRLIDDRGLMDLARRREAAQVIARNARMLLKHVNDLLDMSKLEAGKLKIELVDADVAGLVRFLAAHFAVLAAERKISFTVNADDACVAAVDPDKLQRVVMNLLANAFKFVPDGGQVRCTLRASERNWTVSVEDSGPGVRPELRTAIFERFRQGDGGTNRKTGGTGLGLAIAKEFVELHKGRIEVLDSNLGGARFSVTIPMHRVNAVAERDAALDTGIDRTTLEGLIEELRPMGTARPREGTVIVEGQQRARVLVVEDNPEMNQFIKECLEGEYEVICAFDGREGLEKAMRYHPALVVTDIMMPVVSGDEMIAELRQVPALQTTPVLLLSAKADENLMVKLLDQGAKDFIVKPFSEKELAVRVRNLVAAELSRQEMDHLRIAAEAANRTKDEFLAMLGHELRNPLSPIVTALQLMKLQDAAGDDPGGAKGGMQVARVVIERQVNHLLRLVDDLLDVSRIARGQVELKPEVVELGEVVAKAIEQASPLVEQRGHTLTVHVPMHGLRVSADPTRLSQVVANLLTNAAKYTPAGGQITMSAETLDQEVVLRVKDSGIGIAPDVLPHIFDLFVQDRQAIDRSQGGLGLGLTIVRNLVQLHGGSVSAQSAGRGQGSEFIVRLPRVLAPQNAVWPQASPAPGQAQALTGAPRVLIVDDNEDGSKTLARVLALSGHETRVAHDAATALEMAAQFRPEIAILDIGLPVMDGYELAARLRQIKELNGLRLIALTGYGQESDRQRAQEAGFDCHLVKPVDFYALEIAMSMTART